MISNFNALAFEIEHDRDFQKSASIAIEIDSEFTEFETEIFRVWYGVANLGVFYQTKEGWIAEPFYGNPHRTRTLCCNPNLARDVIIAGYRVRGLY
jgi:hypothetical protein